MTILVTGIGAITSLGATAESSWERLVRGERGLSDLSLFATEGYRTRRVAEVAASPPGGDASAKRDEVSRTSDLALAAAREALACAGLALAERPRGLRLGLVVGGTTAGMLETESLLAVLLGPGAPGAPSRAVDAGAREQALARMLSHPLSAPTDRLARLLGPFSRVRSLSSACSSGANALMIGATWLELGLADAVLCGAADAHCRVTLSGFGALAALDPDGARPFDRRRRGLTLGEGAGFVVLERSEDAARRGARGVCSLLGFASRSEAHHITNPDPSGEAPAAAMRAALARAGLGPADVDYVNAHGTGTPLGDAMEARALSLVLGDHLDRVLVSSQKGQIGHTLAAAGAIEAVITALAIARGVAPPTGGLEEPDPACPLAHVLRAEARPIRAALSSSFGFGGLDTVLVFGRPEARAPERPPPRAVVVTGAAALTPAGVSRGLDLADLPARAPGGEVVTIEPEELDLARARRLDRASRLAAVALGHAFGPSPPRDAGVVLGSAFGAVDATSAFMRRLADKGPRFVSPADFPSLVPSSPAGHVSIYLGLSGAALVVADLATSGECALAQAFELVRAGELDRAGAVAVEERSTIVEQVLRVLFRPEHGVDAPPGRGAPAARREGAAAVALAAEDVAAREGAPILARVADVVAWTDAEAPLAALAAPPAGAIVVTSEPSSRGDDVLARSAWAACPRVTCAPACGAHEAAGGVAVAVAAAKVARGDAAAALALGTARGWGYAALLTRCARPS